MPSFRSASASRCASQGNNGWYWNTASSQVRQAEGTGIWSMSGRSSAMPPARRIKKVLVAGAAGTDRRQGGPNGRPAQAAQGFQDQADLYRLLLTFPELKKEEGPVAERLRAAGAGEDVMAAWKELVGAGHPGGRRGREVRLVPGRRGAKTFEGGDMGKPTGFMEYPRELPLARPPPRPSTTGRSSTTRRPGACSRNRAPAAWTAACRSATPAP